MNTERFVEALSACKLSPTEIADILWLALRQPLARPSHTPDAVESGDSIRQETVAPSLIAADAFADTREGDTTGVQSRDSSFDIAAQPLTGTLPTRALPISVPDVGFLGETLPLVRALRPLLKRVTSRTVSRVNEVATVDRFAETDIWSPVMQADQEPWFEVALIIDRSPAMTVWQRLIEDIQRLLRCYGSFRDLRTWELVDTEGTIGLRSASDRSLHSPKELLAPDGRRLVMVFSDCTADYWWNGTLQPVLALWGAAMPTVVWQVLPDWMWKRTALGVGEYVAIRNRIAGAANQALKPTFLALRPPKRLQAQRTGDRASMLGASSSPPICLPVITTDWEAIAAWSRMLAGDRRQVTPGFVLPFSGWERFHDRSATKQDECLEQFRLRATPAARRLAALLSAAPVITLPVMRLIRTAMLSESSPLPVAEVFLSGLLQRAAEQPDTSEPELVQYVFLKEARKRLLDILPSVEAIEVIEAVSQHVAERLNCTLADFRALLLSPDLQAEADRYGLRAFARITAEILRRLGGDYEALADQFDHPHGSGVRDAELIDFPLEDLEYEVAQLINFPPLQPCEYESATITAILDRFDFETATLAQETRLLGLRREWVIQRRRAATWGYTEPLSADSEDPIGLDMIAIPGGSFTMGAPKRESESLDNERPQHEVTLQPFYLARYPITQAQWRVVAGYDQLDRALDPDPSHFKGANRPVEQVSWDDAQEFCKRLSVSTGKDYRLPSEAEWEYACRAETKMPFHFGETITTELANYRGTDEKEFNWSGSYAQGPKGEYRGATTDVGGLPANQWGLHDMHGNVWEWCEDDYHSNYEDAPTDGRTWVELDRAEANRLLRGGSWYINPRYCRSAYRLNDTRDNRNDSIGFRVCCVPPRTFS